MPTRGEGLGFSILILTLNEESAIHGCLASIRECDDIVVLDSGSTDRTAEIAREAGARVIFRPFDTMANQRNYAQEHIGFRHPWVLHLNADERMSVQLKLECAGVMHLPIDGLYARPATIWEGAWVDRDDPRTIAEPRFVRAPQFRFVARGRHVDAAPEMRMDRLITRPIHDPSIRGEDELLQRHRAHATVEARTFLDDVARTPLSNLVSTDPVRRQHARHRLHHALPFRALRLFLHRYVVRRGFACGLAGLTYCRWLARCEALTVQEIRRLRRAE